MNSTLEDLGTHDAVVSYDVCDVLQQDASVHCTKSEVGRTSLFTLKMELLAMKSSRLMPLSSRSLLEVVDIKRVFCNVSNGWPRHH